MILTDIATNAEVRTILGVDALELTDTLMNLPLTLLALDREFRTINSTLVADFDTVHAISAGSRTAAEALFHDSAQLFGAFALAKHFTTSLPMFSPKSKGDGKALVSKFSDAPYQAAIDSILAKFDTYRLDLATLYAEYAEESAPVASMPVLLGISSPTTDEVTNT